MSACRMESWKIAFCLVIRSSQQACILSGVVSMLFCMATGSRGVADSASQLIQWDLTPGFWAIRKDCKFYLAYPCLLQLLLQCLQCAVCCHGNMACHQLLADGVGSDIHAIRLHCVFAQVCGDRGCSTMLWLRHSR